MHPDLSYLWGVPALSVEGAELQYMRCYWPFYFKFSVLFVFSALYFQMIESYLRISVHSMYYLSM